ncbi:MAG: DEAD/DEAH box helicase, partial [Pseudomonadota bacterium]
MTSPNPITRFEQLALSPPVLKALEEVGYETPSPIQAASIPHLLNGDDLLGQAQTGTGKTAAFALPLLSRLELPDKRPQVLVLAPTRELAIQVAEAFQSYARHLPGFHVLPIYGGQSMATQLRQLRRGVHVVIGTPGRIMDHLRRKSLSLEGLRTLVLDEADEMLRMGFIEDVEWILQHTPQHRQIALFSATMPDVIRKVAHRHLRQPREVKIKTSTTTVAATRQQYWQVSGVHKLDALTRIMEVEDFEAALIFVRTKTATVELAEKLEARGYSCAALNGDMNQALRERTIDQLKDKTLDIVVATDVAARGLDVTRITHVINYDIPNDTEAYVHRIGRTGRAGRKGTAILFVSPREMRMLRVIERATKQTIERMHLPTSEDVADRRIAQFKQQVVDTLEAEELDFFHDVIGQLEREQNVSGHEIAAALAYLVQRQRPWRIGGRKRIQAATSSQRVEEQDVVPGVKKPRRKDQPGIDMVRYRIEVGREHEVNPKDIVGAIANEAGVESRYIGHIKLYDDHSTVDLPAGMPKEIFNHLKKVRVCQHPLRISLIGAVQSEQPAKNAGKGKKDAKTA